MREQADEGSGEVGGERAGQIRSAVWAAARRYIFGTRRRSSHDAGEGEEVGFWGCRVCGCQHVTSRHVTSRRVASRLARRGIGRGRGREGGRCSQPSNPQRHVSVSASLGRASRASRKRCTPGGAERSEGSALSTNHRTPAIFALLRRREGGRASGIQQMSLFLDAGGRWRWPANGECQGLTGGA